MVKINDLVSIWSARFNRNPPADADAIRSFEFAANLKLPSEYLAFLSRTNGGEGFIGQNYVILWRIEQLRDLNKAFEADLFAPGLLLFGSNGGGDAYAFVTLRESYQVVMVPFIGLQLPDAINCGNDFADFIQNLARRPIVVAGRQGR